MQRSTSIPALGIEAAILWEAPGLWLWLGIVSPPHEGLCLHYKGPTQMELPALRDTPSTPSLKPGHAASGLGEERGEDVAFHERAWGYLWISTIHMCTVLTYMDDQDHLEDPHPCGKP